MRAAEVERLLIPDPFWARRSDYGAQLAEQGEHQNSDVQTLEVLAGERCKRETQSDEAFCDGAVAIRPRGFPQLTWITV